MPYVSLILIMSNASTVMFRFDGEYFHTAGSSKFQHGSTFGMANYKNKALATGGNYAASYNAKTELMDMETLEWSSGPDYPFGK